MTSFNDFRMAFPISDVVLPFGRQVLRNDQERFTISVAANTTLLIVQPNV